MCTSSTIPVGKIRLYETSFNKYSISKVCRLLDVSQLGYYAWLKRPDKSAKLCEYIKKQYWQHKARLGAPSLVHDARDNGFNVSERIISRVLQQLGLRSKAARKFKYKRASSLHRDEVPNLLDRQFNSDKPNMLWVTDITYIKAGEGWLYLRVIIDLFGRQVIGRKISRHIGHHLVCDTLKSTLFRHQSPKCITPQ